MTLPTDDLFALQWHFDRIGDIQAIWEDYTGTGVHVGIYDTGVQYTHPDLDANYDPTRHVVVNGLVRDGANVGDAGHGTSVAGLIAAESNGVDTVGVAFGASVTGINIFNPLSALYVNATDPSGFLAAVTQSANFDIVNNSWGSEPAFTDSLDLPAGFNTLTVAGWALAAANGRGGLGTIVLKASGNEARNANGESLNTSRFVFDIAAVADSGFATSYSNHGANILVAASGNEFQDGDDLGIVTTDLLGTEGYNLISDPAGSYGYTDEFGGTSAATPIVSGVVALMLDANPGLGWRDVRTILAMSATQTGSAIGATAPGAFENGTWLVNGAGTWNGGGMHFHVNYGFGMVNAYNAVRLAEVWDLFGPAHISANEVQSSAATAGPVAIGDLATVDVAFTLSGALTIENVAIHVDITHANFIDLDAYLIAPDGTTVQLLDGSAGSETIASTALTWTFGVEAMRGMDIAGTWTLRLVDVQAGNTGTLNSASLTFFGSTPTTDDTYHYTDEFALMAMLDGARRTLADTNGGTDWIDMAAVHGNASVNLGNLAYSSVNGTQFIRIADGTVIENAVTGDGNDTLRGNAAANTLMGMRGRDSLFGLGGADTLDGGRGDDTAAGGDGDDTYVVDSAGDRTVEAAGAGTGIDTVQAGLTWTLAVNVENLALTGTAAANGTGNASANAIAGNAAANTLSGLEGNDTLTGNGGADTLIGGIGNDTYVNPGAATIVEGAGEGIADQVRSDATYTLGDNIERLFLTGTGAIDGTGNALDNIVQGNTGSNALQGGEGADTLQGGNGNDTLTGGAGLDSLVGGSGNDTYVDPAGDVISESAGGGNDVVQSAVSFNLAVDEDLERLFLSGTSNADGNGNGAANFIQGNNAANVLNGLAGDDTLQGSGGTDTLNGGDREDLLIGGAGRDRIAPGNDTFIDILRFAMAADSTGVNRDTIVALDLNGEDRIDLPFLPAAIAPAVLAGTLSEASFNADLAAALTGGALPIANAVLFDPSAGDLNLAGTLFLVVDANGIAGYQANQDYVFQLLNTTGTLDPTDFV